MNIVQIEARDVKVGDKLIGDDGIPVTITEICKGMPRYTLELRWKNGWNAVLPKTLLEKVV